MKVSAKKTLRWLFCTCWVLDVILIRKKS